MLNRFCFLLAAFLPMYLFAQNDQSVLSHKLVMDDYLYLNNMFTGSNNPTSISREKIDELVAADVNYAFSKGDYHAMDLGDVQKTFNFSLFGIKRLSKVTFEGGLGYTNTADHNRRWNSTLYISPDNPFVIADSIRSNFSTEQFNLDGGFSYQPLPKLNLALRARYNVGTSANQTDPRPSIDGMRFCLNPGVDYSFGQFTVGLSGTIGWLSESSAYTVVGTTEGTYLLFLMHGLAMPDKKTAIGYRRKYTGTNGEANLQLNWENEWLHNFFEFDYASRTEDTEDGDNSEKYKGGKYTGSRIGFTDRFMFAVGRQRHNITLDAHFSNVDGRYYTNKQSMDHDGNIIWEVINSSICHKDSYSDISLEYRWDKLNQTGTPHFTIGVKGGMHGQTVKHYPELYTQKHSLFTGEAYVKKFFPMKKVNILLNADLAYAQRLTSENVLEGSAIDEKFFTPQYEYLSGSNMALKLRADFMFNLQLRKFQSALGAYADYGFRNYMGDFTYFNNTARHTIMAGVKFIF